jgi:hypothetical protein
MPSITRITSRGWEKIQPSKQMICCLTASMVSGLSTQRISDQPLHRARDEKEKEQAKEKRT